MNWNELVPYLAPEVIRARTESFWRIHNPENIIPLPIEEIAEFRLGINIVPLPGLLKNHQIDGFISSDLTEISVDLDVAEHSPHRYRFTIAHEIGHRDLHRAIYQNADFRNTGEWMSWNAAMPRAVHRDLEKQASIFARMVLAPRQFLVPAFESCLDRIEAAGLVFTNHEDTLCRTLGKQFGISQQAMRYCLINEDLLESPR